MELPSTLPKKPTQYLQEIINIAKENEIDLESIVVFGSVAKGGYQEDISDVDTIVVLSDEATKKQKRFLNKRLKELEFEFGFRKKNKSPIDFIYRIAERITGMFISHFECFKTDFLNGDFVKVFNVNPVLATIIAPQKIVWASVVTSSITVWGNDLLEDVKIRKITKFELRKSRFMNSFLCFAAMLTYPFHINATKFAMESLKWTIQSTYFCYTKKSSATDIVIEYFKEDEEFQSILEEMIELRKTYRKSFSFIYRSLVGLRKIHKKALKTISFPIELKEAK